MWFEVFLKMQVFLINTVLVNKCINHLYYFFLKILLKWPCALQVSCTHFGAPKVSKVTGIIQGSPELGQLKVILDVCYGNIIK